MSPETLVDAARPLAWTLMHSLWQGALVAIGLAVALAAMRRQGARLRYGVAAAALVLLIALPAITLTRQLAAGPAPEFRPVFTLESERPRAAAPGELAWVAVTGDGPGLPVLRERVAGWLDSLSPWIVLFWLSGAGSLSYRNICELRLVRRLAHRGTRPLEGAPAHMLERLLERQSIRRSVRVLQSTVVRVPTLIGWLRPVILVPVGAVTGLPPAQLQALLAHELAHLRRHDYLVNLLQVGVETVMFYHPAVWWVSRRLRIERELCCDDMAVEACGDRLVYARALTEMERLRSETPLLAVGADGDSLSRRIRRLIGSNQVRGARPTSWYPGLLALVAVLSIAFLALPSVAGRTDEEKGTDPFSTESMPTPSEEPVVAAAAEPVAEPSEEPVLATGTAAGSEPAVAPTTPTDATPQAQGPAETEPVDGGRWKIRFNRHSVELEIRISRSWFRSWSSTTTLPKRDLVLVSGTYGVRHDAGILLLDGLTELRSRGSDSGRLHFAPDLEFFGALERLGYGHVEPELQLRLALHDVELELIEEMGPERASLEDLIKLQIHGVKLEYVRALARVGYDELRAEETIHLRIHGVQPEWAGRMAEAGYGKLAVEDLTRLKIHGLSPDYLSGLARAGLTDVPLDDVIKLRIHGIDPAWTQGMIDSGYRELTVEQLVRLKVHGVNPQQLGELARAGYADEPLERIIKLRIHGVDPAYAAALTELGYGSVDEVVALKIQGIHPDYIRGMQEAGIDPLPLSDLKKLKVHGISPESVREIYSTGHRGDSVEELIKLKIHGVGAGYIRGIEEAGLTDLSVEQLQRLKIHGINPDYVRDIYDAGDRDDSIEELIKLRTHGISGAFIREMAEHGHDDLSVERLIKLKIHGGRDPGV